eukprot:6204122-Pleurochrysis_carterae.AAC.1
MPPGTVDPTSSHAKETEARPSKDAIKLLVQSSELSVHIFVHLMIDPGSVFCCSREEACGCAESLLRMQDGC